MQKITLEGVLTQRQKINSQEFQQFTKTSLKLANFLTIDYIVKIMCRVFTFKYVLALPANIGPSTAIYRRFMMMEKRKIQPGFPLLRQFMWPKIYIGGLLLLLLTTPATANDQDTRVLHQSVLDYLQKQTASRTEQDIEINVGHIDRRLKLAKCKNTPTPFLAAGAKLQGKLTVGLRCTGPKPWTVYIPAEIKIFAEVLVAAQPLLRGAKINASNVMFVRQNLNQLRSGYYTEINGVIGKVLMQNLAAGHAINPKRIKAPILVRRGEMVSIVASVGALKVKGKGKALGDAAQGELISVRNSRSKRIVQGIVTKPGTVNVQM